MKSVTDGDPRIRRTRQMLFQALRDLLSEKNFADISMQDIAERSTVNRATIYAHFADKVALLESLIHEDFGILFATRTATASGTCRWGVKQLILAVCDYLGPLMECSTKHQRAFDPVVESTVRKIVRDFLLDGLRKSERVASCADAQLRATAASYAICGTAVEWGRTRSVTADEFADAVLPLVATGLFLPDAEVV